ncbi:MAG: hypothetical protein AAFQ98_15360 [Bacteroidota bacterium]
MQTITLKQRKQINAALPDFAQLLAGQEKVQGAYQNVFVSVFDHWLSREEAEALIMIDHDQETLRARRALFREFAVGLYWLTPLFGWKYKRRHRLHVLQPAGVDDVLRACDLDNLWSQSGRRYGFLLPEYAAIYQEEWDWTNLIRYRDQQMIQPMLDLVEQVGLHVLL